MHGSDVPALSQSGVIHPCQVVQGLDIELQLLPVPEP